MTSKVRGSLCAKPVNASTKTQNLGGGGGGGAVKGRGGEEGVVKRQSGDLTMFADRFSCITVDVHAESHYSENAVLDFVCHSFFRSFSFTIVGLTWRCQCTRT